MMPPMMRGGGENGSSGERARQVLDTSITRPSARRAGADEEHQVVPRGAQSTSSSTPFMPPMSGGPMGGGGPGGQETQSGDRERTTWLAEEEDVWGTDEGGAPQALGR